MQEHANALCDTLFLSPYERNLENIMPNFLDNEFNWKMLEDLTLENFQFKAIEVTKMF